MNPLDPNSPFNGPLTPVHFRQQNPIQTTPSTPNSSPSSKKRYIPLVIAGLALLILPVTIWQINTQQDIRQRASEVKPSPIPQQLPIVAKVGNETITEADIDLEYTKQQNATTYRAAPSNLKDELLAAVIEKTIIKMEAKKRQISVTDEELNEAIALLQSENPTVLINKELVKDDLLAQKIAYALAPSITANIVMTKKDTPELEALLETIYEEATSIGSLLNSARPLVKGNSEVLLLENQQIAQNNMLFSEETTAEIILLPENELSEIVHDNESIAIIEVLSKNNGEFESYDTWLEEQKEKLVTLSSK